MRDVKKATPRQQTLEAKTKRSASRSATRASPEYADRLATAGQKVGESWAAKSKAELAAIALQRQTTFLANGGKWGSKPAPSPTSLPPAVAKKFIAIGPTKSAIEFKRWMGRDLCSQVAAKYQLSLDSGTTKPQLRRAYSSLAPKAYSFATTLSTLLFKGGTQRSYFFDRLLKYAIGHHSIKSCPGCGEKFLGGTYCSVPCASKHATQTESACESRRQSCLDEYGHPNPMQAKRVSKKVSINAQARTTEHRQRINKTRERTVMAEHGVTNIAKLPDQSEKARSGILRRFGSWKAYGDHRAASVARTCGKRYGPGIRHPMQVHWIYAKVAASWFMSHSVESKLSGVLRVQGSAEASFVREADANRLLLEVVAGCIYYDHNGTGRRYYPDFFAKQLDTGRSFLVEVKSAWTLSQGFEVNLLKFKAASRWCKRHGVTFVLCVDNSNGPFTKILWPTRSKILRVFRNNKHFQQFLSPVAA